MERLEFRTKKECRHIDSAIILIVWALQMGSKILATQEFESYSTQIRQ